MIVKANATFLDLTGFSREQLVGQRFAELPDLGVAGTPLLAAGGYDTANFFRRNSR